MEVSTIQYTIRLSIKHAKLTVDDTKLKFKQESSRKPNKLTRR